MAREAFVVQCRFLRGAPLSSMSDRHESLLATLCPRQNCRVSLDKAHHSLYYFHRYNSRCRHTAHHHLSLDPSNFGHLHHNLHHLLNIIRWAAHIVEERKANKLIRPTAVYTGVGARPLPANLFRKPSPTKPQHNHFSSTSRGSRAFNSASSITAVCRPYPSIGMGMARHFIRGLRVLL